MLKLSPDEAALLKAVCADRESDLPRLVYADWLDDHGRLERAEFIRLQCEHERLRFEQSRLRHHELMRRIEIQDRIQAMLGKSGDRWVRELPKWTSEWYGGGSDRPAFVRGFVECVDVSASWVVRHAPQLFDRTPVRQLSLRHAAAVWPDVVRCDWLSEVPVIEMWAERLSDEHGAALVQAEWLQGTRKLNLRSNDFGDVTARTLAGCRQLAGLEELDLSRNGLTIAGVRTLARSSTLFGLRVLDLTWNAHLAGHLNEVRDLFEGRLHLRVEDDL